SVGEGKSVETGILRDLRGIVLAVARRAEGLQPSGHERVVDGLNVAGRLLVRGVHEQSGLAPEGKRALRADLPSCFREEIPEGGDQVAGRLAAVVEAEPYRRSRGFAAEPRQDGVLGARAERCGTAIGGFVT